MSTIPAKVRRAGGRSAPAQAARGTDPRSRTSGAARFARWSLQAAVGRGHATHPYGRVGRAGATSGLPRRSHRASSWSPAAGGKLSSEGRLLFPPALVEDMLVKVNRQVVLHGQEPKHDMELRGSRVYFGTAGAAVHVVDCDGRAYRESTLADLYNMARLVDALEHIHFFQRPLVCRDVVDLRELDINTAYACVAGTTKHVGTSFTQPEFVDDTMPMLHWMRRGRASMARTSVREHVELLRGAALAFRRGRLPVSRKPRCAKGCRCCCWPPGRPARPARRRWPVRWCKKWRRCWPGWSTSTCSIRDIQRFSGLGRSSRTCAPGP